MKSIFSLVSTGIFLSVSVFGSDITVHRKTDSFTPNRVVKFNGMPMADGSIEIYAHRGGRGLMPEHTMPAYISMLRLGVDYIDMDIGMTKDGVLVVTHDLGLNPSLTRNAKGEWITEATPIHNMPLEDVQEYNVGMLKPGTKYASCFPHQKSIDAYIPTLKEVVESVKKIAGNKVGFQIEIKNDPTKPELTATPKEFAAALYKLMKKEDIINITEVEAFDWRCLVELNKLDPKIKTAYLSDHTTEVMDDFEKGTWTAGLKPKDYDYSLPKMVKRLGGYCWEPFEMDLTKKDLDEAHILGLKVVPWGWPEEEGCNEFNYEQIEKMIDWGVDGIITDRPDILMGLLVARGYNIPKGFIIKD